MHDIQFIPNNYILLYWYIHFYSSVICSHMSHTIYKPVKNTFFIFSIEGRLGKEIILQTSGFNRKSMSPHSEFQQALCLL